MRLILKLIAAPFVVLLTVLVAVLLFLFSLSSSFFLTAASVIVGLLGVGLFFLGYPVGAVAYLVIAFLLSPLGLQAAADFIIGKMDDLNLSLRQFITS